MKKISIIKQKKIYLILIVIISISFIIGLIYPFFLSSNNKIILSNSVKEYFNILKTSDIRSINYFINSLLINMGPLIVIWIMGISIVGIPIIILILMYKSFILGLYISSIIYTFGFKGVIFAIFYVFPHHIVSLIVFMLMSFYGLKFSYNLFRYFFIKKDIIRHIYTNKYIKVLMISLIVLFCASIYEIYINSYVLRFFTNILK